MRREISVRRFAKAEGRVEDRVAGVERGSSLGAERGGDGVASWVSVGGVGASSWIFGGCGTGDSISSPACVSVGGGCRCIVAEGVV